MSNTPTYTESYSAAKGHGKAFLQSTIGAHPGTTAVVMGLLIVLVLILSYKLYEKDYGKSGFISPVNNLTTGNNNPLWQLGAMDAGNWGPVHRDATAWNVAAYHPGWRPGGGGTCYGKEGAAVGCGREGLTGPVAPNGGTIYLRPGPPSLCGRGWDPAASAEAEALATVGALQHEGYGEGRLQGAIDTAYDSSHGLSDDQLAALMHQGGTP